MTARTPMPPPMPPAVRFVLVTILVNAIGFGIVVPVIPMMVMELAGGTVSQATAIGGWLSFTYALTQFVFSPVMGNLSDRFGRRPVLLASLGGFAIDFLVLALAPTLAWVFAVRAAAGALGATNGPAQAVIADVTRPEERARYFGLIGAAFGAGFVFGPAIGGLLGLLGHRVPFFVAAGLILASMVYGYFALPETLDPENRRRFEWRRANPVGALLQARRLKGLGGIATVYFLWQVATLVYPMIWSYFAIGRYGWSTGLVGISLAGVGIAMVAMQALVLPRAVARWGERGTALRGGVAAALSMAGYAAATQGWMALALLPLMASQSLVHPNLTAMMTRRADATTQGEVQGFASAVMAVGSLVAPLTFNPLLAWSTGPAAPVQFWGSAFVFAALNAALAMLILWRLPRAQGAEPDCPVKSPH